MENTTVPKYAGSFGFSLALASVVNALLVVIKERSPTVMSGMKNITGHHWITHSVIVLVVFVLFGWIFSRFNNGKGMELTVGRLVATLISGVGLGIIMIVGFYLIGD